MNIDEHIKFLFIKINLGELSQLIISEPLKDSINVQFN